MSNQLLNLKSVILFFSLFILILTGCKENSTGPSTSTQNEYKIAFVSYGNGSGSQIFIINSDSTGRKKLTTDTTVYHVYPEWSPDGTKILFVQKSSSGGWEAFLMNSDGSDQTRISTSGDDYDERPTWSPDGKKIMMSGITVMNSDGTNQHLLAGGRSPVWSKDGSKIAYLTGEPRQIFIMDSNGTNQHQLTTVSAGSPSWSPDGKKIAYVSSLDGSAEIFTVNIDGTNLIRLTNDAGTDIYPSWSPDGTKILFVSNRGGFYDVYSMNPDGTKQTRLTNDTTASNRNREAYPPPQWSPDGKNIVYIHGYFSNNMGIFMMSADGIKQQRLSLGLDLYASWSRVPIP